MTDRNTDRPSTNRRDFLKGSALAGAAFGVGFWVTGRATAADDLKSNSPNEKLNAASIGIGGKGDSDSEHVGKHANLVAICDVDESRLAQKAEKFPKAKKFTDFRRMFDAMHKDIDCVSVSTPDHTHAFATLTAMSLGKHVYTQKPLTHDVAEARLLRETAKRQKVATQMGNQGTASHRFREGVEAIRAGALGAVKEVHIWTNRPIWPQSPEIKAKPEKADPPKDLKWDLWLGTAPDRPYAKKFYHPFNWRGWWDFGTGALGDMGCHTANLPFMALRLGHPSTIQGESEELNPETYPAWARVNFDFPEREGMPPVRVTWYEGHKDGVLVHPPKELAERVLKESAAARKAGEDHGEKGEKDKKDNATGLPRSGSIVVGEKGIMYSPHDYGGYWELLPGEAFRDFKAPEKTLPRNPDGGDEGQKIEWLAACKGGPPALSNFDYAGMLTEFILLGNIAVKAQGKKLEWNGPGMTFSNAPEADKWLRREYRQGWDLPKIA